MTRGRGAIGTRPLLLALLLAGLSAVVGVPAASAQETFALELQGRRLEIPLRRIAGLRYVALGELARAFGSSVEWLEPGERAAAAFLGERVVFRRNLPFVEARGAEHQIPQPPRFEAGELYVPFSFIQQGLPAIFPERFDFEIESSRLRQGPPGRGVEGIEYLVAPGLTTLRFFFAGSPQPGLQADNSVPHTLVLRLEGARLGPLYEKGLASLGLVDSLRLEGDAQGAERLVFFLDEEAFLYQVARLEEPAGFEVTLFSPAAGVEPEKVLARGMHRPEGLPSDRPAAGGTAATAPPPVSASPPVPDVPIAGGAAGRRKERTGIRMVVIDAGHGGRDVGAVGPRGALEKNVTLQVARALRAELERRSDLRVVLTRDDDTFVPLTARTRMANEAGANLFISIHCNSARARSGAGFETYFLSEATTEDERRVARMENASLRFENPDVDPDRLGELNFILWDLAQNEYLRESSFLAELVQRGLADELDLRDRGVKQAGFWVLNGAFMPAILVETAFISNPDEERLLVSRDFQGRLVDGLADSVMEYIDLYERKVTPEVGA